MLGSPPLARPTFVALKGEVRSVERLPAQRMSRVLVRPIGMPALPSLVRVNLDDASMPAGVGEGAIIAFRTRLMPPAPPAPFRRSEEHTSELQSLMRLSYAVFCLKK